MRMAQLVLMLLVVTPLLADEPQSHLGLPYTDLNHVRQTLDVYAPAKGERRPVVVREKRIPPFLILHVADRPDSRAQLDKLKKLGARITLDDRQRVIVVNLGERKVTDDDLALLRGLPHLQELDLTRTRITGAGLANLKDLKTLRKLYLTDTKVDDAGLAPLKDLKNLELVGLSGTSISDAAFDHLRDLAALKQLFCLGTKVTDAGVEKLQHALPDCQITH